MEGRAPKQMHRREFLENFARASVLTLAIPPLLQACARTRPDPTVFTPDTYKEMTREIEAQAQSLVGDVVDFSLTSDQWEGVFGFVRFRLHRGAFDGEDIYFIRTDASDEAFASAENLVFVPKLAPLAEDGLSRDVFLFLNGAEDQPAVFTSEPGRDDYTPAWRVNRVTWNRQPRVISSARDVEAAQSAGDLSIQRTAIILNAAVVKWSSGELAVDSELREYLGGGQLIERPDTTGLTITFKLHECFPGTRYIVTDHSIGMAAEMTQTALAPGLQSGPTRAGTTGRTNVFMNGIEGPGPMGFQPSAFDFAVGDALWSPYWDHITYAWREGETPRLLHSETDIHRARDAGELEEFPGVPETEGELFTVNCPAPIRAPNVFGS